MSIDLITYKSSLEEGELNNENIISWFSMNKNFIEKLVKKYIREYGWIFGGASEMYLDLKQLYRDHPYNLEEKYVEENPSFLLMAA